MKAIQNFDDMSDIDSVSESQLYSPTKNKKRVQYGTKKRTYIECKPKSDKKVVDSGQAFRKSLWKLDENIAYMQYLIENQQLFYASVNQRKNMKINVLMSESIKSRSPDQCRSHHQKMIKYHKDIPTIISYIRSLESCQQQEKIDSLVDPYPLVEASPQPQEEEQMRSLSAGIVIPTCDWDSWIMKNEMQEQNRQIEQWLDGVEDKYGNL